MQRLPRHADWDTREVRDDVRDYVASSSGIPPTLDPATPHLGSALSEGRGRAVVSQLR
jgi:hypothetical protein